MKDEEIQKRLEWLDEERRKDKNTLAALQDQLKAFEEAFAAAQNTIKGLTADVSRLLAQQERLEQFDLALSKHRQEIKRILDEQEEKLASREQEATKLRRLEVEGISDKLDDLRKEISVITEIRQTLDARMAEETRQKRQLDEINRALETLKQGEDERKRALRRVEDARNQDTKRLTDLIGEVSALSKRLEEHRGRSEVVTDNLRRVELRLEELLAAEESRRKAQEAFQKEQTLLTAQREKTWRSWETRFQSIEEMAKELAARLESLSLAERDVRQAQKEFEEMTERMERRIHEVTEMQRLNEDRTRQEWVQFKAEDQKRWANYTVTQEELQKDTERQLDKIRDRLSNVEDLLQDLSDMIHQLDQQTVRGLQSMLTLLRDWLTEYERVTEHIR